MLKVAWVCFQYRKNRSKSLKLKKKTGKIMHKGHLAGSVGGACDSRSWAHEFKPHAGWGAYLKLKLKLKKYTKKRIFLVILHHTDCVFQINRWISNETFLVAVHKISIHGPGRSYIFINDPEKTTCAEYSALVPPDPFSTVHSALCGGWLEWTMPVDACGLWSIQQEIKPEGGEGGVWGC